MSPGSHSSTSFLSYFRVGYKDDGEYDDEVDDNLRETRAMMHNDEEGKAPLNNLVITLTDPDAPSRKNPEWSEMCHWIAVGLPVNVTSSTCSSSTISPHPQPFKDIMPYKAPGPPPKTGKHRYVLVAYVPKNGTAEPLDLVAPNERQHWGGEESGGVAEWAEGMGLVAIGEWCFFFFSWCSSAPCVLCWNLADAMALCSGGTVSLT